MRTFFDTTFLNATQLEEATKLADKQDERIYLIMCEAQKGLTPFEVKSRYHKIYPKANIQITSVRRALSMLTKARHLKKDVQRNGIFKRKNYTWVIIHKSTAEAV